MLQSIGGERVFVDALIQYSVDALLRFPKMNNKANSEDAGSQPNQRPFQRLSFPLRVISLVINLSPAALVSVVYGSRSWRKATMTHDALRSFGSERLLEIWIETPQFILRPLGLGLVIYLISVGLVEVVFRRSWGFAMVSAELLDPMGHRASRARRALRALARSLSVLSLGLGGLWMLVSRSGQTWHDFIAGVTVVSKGRRTPSRRV